MLRHGTECTHRCFSKVLCVVLSLRRTVCICPLLSVLFYDLFVQINKHLSGFGNLSHFFCYVNCDYYNLSHMHTTRVITAERFALIHCRQNHSRDLEAAHRNVNVLHTVW